MYFYKVSSTLSPYQGNNKKNIIEYENLFVFAMETAVFGDMDAISYNWPPAWNQL